MYNLKRILDKMKAIQANSNSEPDVMGEALDNFNSLTTDALVEFEIAENAAMEQPQEMRDFFAGAALVGLLMRPYINNDEKPDEVIGPLHFEKINQRAWAHSTGMMIERARLIEARKAVGS